MIALMLLGLQAIDWEHLRELQRFRDAIGRDRTKDVQRMLESSSDLLKEPDRDGRLPLHFCWTKEMAELLLAKGADLQARDKEGRTLLYHWVRDIRDPEQIEFLLAHGADPNLVPGRESLVWISLGNRKEEIALLLIRYKARVDHAYDGETLLHVAAMYQAPKVLRLALDAKLPVNGAMRSGHTPPHWAVGTGYTALHWAVGGGSMEMVRLLVEAGAEVNATTAPGGHFIGGINRTFNGSYTPFLMAVSGGHVEIARYLLEKGAMAKVKDFFGLSPLDHAARLGKPELVQLVLDTKPEVDPAPPKPVDPWFGPSFPGFGSPLHLAAESGSLEAVALLVKTGANVNIRDAAGRGPIHRVLDDLMYGNVLGSHVIEQRGETPKTSDKARKGNRVEIVKLLIEKGADVHAKDDQGVTALKLAVDSGNEEAANLLRKAGAKE